MKKRIAIVFYEGYLSVAPTLLNIISFLDERGYKVDLLTRRTDEGYAPLELPHNLHIITFDNHLSLNKQRIAFRLKKYRKKYERLYADFLYYLNVREFISFCKNHFKQNQYDVVIGVDTVGLSAAGEHHKYSKTKLIYLSLEIDFLKQHIFPGNMLFKLKEILFHRKSFFTIIQDQVRLDCLQRENLLRLKTGQYYFLPNSPRSSKKKIATFSNYFKEKFHLKSSDFIVLSAGMIHESVFSKEVAMQCALQTNLYKMIFHERNERDVNTDSYLKEVQDAGGADLILSLKPVAYSEIAKVYNSADIGLAIYNSGMGANFSNIVYASGKLSHYLQFGKPVIVNNLPGMKIVEDRKCGIVIDSISDLNPAIEEIKRRYEFYSENALQCYRDIFDFDIHISRIVEHIDK